MTGGTRQGVSEKQFAPDWWLFLVTLLLVGGGVVMVFNASYALASEVAYTGGDPAFFPEAAGALGGRRPGRDVRGHAHPVLEAGPVWPSPPCSP